MPGTANLDIPLVRNPFDDTTMRRLIALREDLHRHPELAFEEERTTARLLEELQQFTTDLGRVGRTGAWARIRGERADAPVVAIRGDIDALPIHEATGLPFSSTTPGVMHACGHDVHATWAVAAARLLAAHPAVGDVVVVLQPAEETGRGAPAVLDAGILDGVAAIFGAHVDRRFAVGQVVADVGPLAASADSFSIEFVGSGAHGARPHEATDPIVATAQFVAAVQTAVSRRLNPATPGVVSIGTLRAGSAPNVIPDRATVEGTIRSIDPDSRALLREEVERIAVHVGAAHRVEALITHEYGTPPIVNPERPVTWAREAVIQVLGADALAPLGLLNMGGEDFAYYMEKMEGCFLRIGAREAGTENIPAHTPRFYAATESIFIGGAVLAETARIASLALDG